MVTTMESEDNITHGKGSQDLADQASLLLSQLNYAGQIRSNYENQLLNLQAALQSERKNKGEHQLKLHELEQAIEGLKRNESELLNQIEHWRRKAQTAMEQRALASSQPENQAQILQDIERLQQGEAYWRRQASHLTQQYEQAEDDVRRLIREVQTRAEMIKEKENTERSLRQEIHTLTQKLRESMSNQNSPRAELTSVGSKYSSKNQVQYEMDSEEHMTNFARVVKLQTVLLHQGNYEEAERLALSFHDNPSIVHEIEAARGHVTLSSGANREINYLSTPRNERPAPTNWNRANFSSESSPNGTTSNQPNSTAPPLYQKLALENRLASFPHTSSLVESECRWAVKVGILEAINLPYMTSSDGTQLSSECYACVSLLHSEADFASQNVKSLEHIHGNNGARSWLLGQVHGIAWIQGHLKVRAMGKSSAVKYVNNAAHWAEAFILRAIHADALEATNNMSEFSSESLPLDGRPAVILVTVHHAREDFSGRLIARASLRIRAGEEFHQWYKLHDIDGKPLFAGPSKPAMIRIRSAYSGGSIEDHVNDKSGSPKSRGDEKQTPIHLYQNEENTSRQKGAESGTVVSATLGFFSMTPESENIKPSVNNSMRDLTGEHRPAEAALQQPALVLPLYRQESTETERTTQNSPTNFPVQSTIVKVMTGPSVQDPNGDVTTAHLQQLTSSHNSASHDSVSNTHIANVETSVAQSLTTSGNHSAASSMDIRMAESQATKMFKQNNLNQQSTNDLDKSASRPGTATRQTKTTSLMKPEEKILTPRSDSLGTQPYVLPRAKVLPVQQVSPFKLQEMAGAKNSKGIQNRPLSTKVADTIARLDNSMKPNNKDASEIEDGQAQSATNHDPDFVRRDANLNSAVPVTPQKVQTPPRQESKVGQSAVEKGTESSVQWVSKTIEFVRTAPAGKQGAERVGVGIAIASHGSGQPFVSALAPNGPAKLSGQILEGDKIIAVNGKLVAGMNVYNIIQLILGVPGSVVRLDIETAKSDGSLKGPAYRNPSDSDAPRQRSSGAVDNRQSLPKPSDEGSMNSAGVLTKSQAESIGKTATPLSSSTGSKQLNVSAVSTASEPVDAQGSISVNVLKATKIRTLSGDRKPSPSVQLRISGGIPPESRYKTSKAVATTTPEWNKTITLPIVDVDRAQLECSLWHEQEDSLPAKNNDDFLGEVVLNLSKLKPYQGKYIEQVFEIKPSKVYQCSFPAAGKLKLGLKLDMPPVGPFSKPWK